MILARREELASGLRRPLSATWPGGVPQEHPGRLELWVGLQDISKVKPPAWPLLKARAGRRVRPRAVRHRPAASGR